MKELLPISLICLLLSSCIPTNQSIAKTNNNNISADRSSAAMPSKPGACYAKCLIQAQSETFLIGEFPVYTGDNYLDNIDLDTVTFTTIPESTKWVKKKADLNCLSDNPEDCLVWCLQKVDAVNETLIIVKDTTSTTQYKLVKLEEERIVDEGGYTEWKETICEDKQSSKLISDIQTFLNLHNIYDGEINGDLNSKTKEALVYYQKLNALPVGQLDLETLDLMEVQY